LVETILIGFSEFSSDNTVIVSLISIYDKADVENISDKELRDLIKNFRNRGGISKA
jgi:hypothetical protein